MSTSVLEVQGLSVSIATPNGILRAVRAVDLQVARGETLCIVGESGCGKSMTSLALMGLLPQHAAASAARMAFLGEDVGANALQSVRGSRVAMIFQEPMTALNPAWTVGEQLVEGLLHHDRSVSEPAARARAIALLETCGIGDAPRRMAQFPHQLSGGLRQRVMIAMALMTQPDLLIADEPTTALDVTVQAQILHLLDTLKARLSLAVILITHDIGVVRRIADRVAVMYAGEIVESGTADAVLGTPLHPYTRALLSCVPERQMRGTQARLGVLAGVVPSLLGDPDGCSFRARCAQARAVCAATVPRRQARPGHDYLCVLPPDLEPVGAMARAVAEPPALPRAEMSAVPLVEVRGLEVTYPAGGRLFGGTGRIAALNGVDLAVRAGEVVGVIGESGCGKSTLARAMLGLEAASSGDVLVLGRGIAQIGRAALARIVQPIFQDPYSQLNPRRAIAATVRLPLDIHHVGTPAERNAAVRRMMDLCGLPARLHTALPHQLSGGQRQRAAIASALVLGPALVICDEPTSALDVSVQAQIINLLQDLRRELGIAFVVISHDLDVISCLADRIAVMQAGRIVEQATAQALFAHPAHDYTRTLLEHGA